MMTNMFSRERKRQAKIVASVIFAILMLVLFVGSWRAKVQVANERIDASWASLSFSLERRQDFFLEIIKYIQQKAPHEKKLLNTLMQNYQSLPQDVVGNEILMNAATNQVFVTRHLAVSVLTPKIAQYTWQNTTLSGDKQYYRKLKNLYVTTYQIKNTQMILNQEIDFYNRSLNEWSGIILNSLFRYPKKLKLGEIVGEQMSIYEFMGETEIDNT
tara:strand:+ start:29564 stop:30208 length:645 start_codon:yes stop_codon:yes gene_type:complete